MDDLSRESLISGAMRSEELQNAFMQRHAEALSVDIAQTQARIKSAFDEAGIQRVGAPAAAAIPPLVPAGPVGWAPVSTLICSTSSRDAGLAFGRLVQVVSDRIK